MRGLVAYVDGGSDGNPGPSGIGVVIEGAAAGTIRISRPIGGQDSNVAEYVALMDMDLIKSASTVFLEAPFNSSCLT